MGDLVSCVLCWWGFVTVFLGGLWDGLIYLLGGGLDLPLFVGGWVWVDRFRVVFDVLGVSVC